MLNYRLPSAGNFSAVSTTDRADLGHHVHVALEKDRGSIALQPDRLFRLVFEPGAQPPGWSEMGIALVDKAWLGCHSILLKCRISAHEPAHVRAALRLYKPDSFHDHFAPTHLELDRAARHLAVDFTLSPRLMHQVRACDLHLFFDNKANTLDVHDLVVTGLR